MNLPRNTRLSTFTGRKKRIAQAYPLSTVGRKAAGWNYAVDVGIQEHVLSPGVENADHANLSAEVFAVGYDLEHGLCAGSEQQIVEQAWVVEGEHVELVRHGKDDVKVAGVEKFLFPRRDPALAPLRLALGTVPVAA